MSDEVASPRTGLADAGDPEPFLAALLSAIPMFIIRADAEQRIRYINRIVPGITRDDVIGAHIDTYVEPAHRDKQRRAIDRVLATGVPESFAVEGHGPSGSVAWYETYVAPIVEADGRRGICLAAVDVSQARIRERALFESEQRLWLAVEASGVGLWSWDLTTGDIAWDERMCDIIGRRDPIDLGNFVDQIVHPDDRQIVLDSGNTSMAGGPWSTGPYRIVRPDGELRWAVTSGRTELGDAGTPVRMVGGTMDITAQHTAEEQLRHAQRLDAVGRLTAGVAHNFNNLLTVVTSTLDLLRRRTTGSSERELIDDALAASQRGGELVQRLMTFAGQRPQLERRARRVDPVVERAVGICGRTFDRHVRLELRCAPGLPAVMCSDAELEQIVVNLLLNARDAVLAAGRAAPRIAIEVDRAPAPGTSEPIGVRVRVTDDGVGMTADTLAHAFEPFFTTKPVGQGTGLGLATSYAIARELGGNLSATSQLGVGTTFTLWLPITDLPVADGEVVDRRGAASRSARLLLVDDEANLRRAVTDLLTDAGYQVVAVASGAEALAHLEVDRAIDVVMLDRSMPGARGELFVPAIRELVPSAKIALFTGQEVEATLAARLDAVIGKPIGADALFEAIEALLCARPSA